MDQSIQNRINFLKRNLKECIGDDIFEKCLETSGTLHVYWGTAPTGKPHIAYFLPMSKLADFLKSGCEVTVLFANLHAFLDDMKAPWELLDKRTEYYEILIKGILQNLGVNLDKLKFIRGTDFQLKENYTSSVFKIIGITSVHDAIKAGCDVVKGNENPFINSLIYPLLQSLDEEFIGVDAQFGGLDQRKIFTYARKNLPILGYAKRSHLMNSMIPGLTGVKMSASDENSKVDLLDECDTVEKKIRNAQWINIDSDVNESTANTIGEFSEKNFFSGFLKNVIWPNASLLNITELNHYNDYTEIESDLKSGNMNEECGKGIVINALNKLMANLKLEFTKHSKESIITEAYPVQFEKNPSPPVELGNCISNYHRELKSLNDIFPKTCEISPAKFPKIIGKPSVLWSCQAMGEPDVKYLVPLIRLAQLSRNGWKVIILIEDIGAYLVNQSSNYVDLKIFKKTATQYRKIIKSVFHILDGDENNLEILCGSEFQLARDYNLLMYQFLARATLTDCKNMIKKMVGNIPDLLSKLSFIFYPCILVVDQAFLKPTLRLFGSYDFVPHFESFANQLKNSLNLNYKMPVPVTHELISFPDKFSMSFLDKSDTIKAKIMKLFFSTDDIDGSAVMNIIEFVLFRFLKDSFKIERMEKNGGNIAFKDIDDLKMTLAKNSLHPKDVKLAVVKYVNEIITLIHENMKDDMDKLFEFLREPRTNIKSIKVDFNPNTLNIKIASVKSITYKHGYKIKLIIENNPFKGRLNKIYSLSPNDECLILMRSSTNKEHSTMIGILCSTMDKLDIRAIRLIRRVDSNNLVFPDHESILPHLKEINSERAMRIIENNIILKGDALMCFPTDTAANIEAKNDSDMELKVVVEHFL